MSNLKLHRTVSLVLFIIGAGMAIVFWVDPGRTNAQTPKTEKRNRTKWEWNDDGWRRRVEIQGKAEFNEQYSDVSDVSEGGLVILEEERHGNVQRLEVRRDQSGQLVRRYFVDGEVRPLDEKGRKWVAGLLLIAVRQGAIDVDKRVKTILRQRGVAGLLDEISSITGEYAKRLYFQAAFKDESLSRSDRQKVLAALGAQITSDHEKANILKNTADMFLSDSALTSAFFQTLATINSDYEHRGALSALLKRKSLSEHALAQLLTSAAAISSDYEKATFLLEASDLYSGDAELRSAFLKTVETIKSDHERGRVLNAMLKKRQIG
jgi:hypothetical protein